MKYKIYTGLDEYYWSDNNPSETNIPNSIYDVIYSDNDITLSKIIFKAATLNKLNKEQVQEILYDINNNYDDDLHQRDIIFLKKYLNKKYNMELTW